MTFYFFFQLFQICFIHFILLPNTSYLNQVRGLKLVCSHLKTCNEHWDRFRPSAKQKAVRSTCFKLRSHHRAFTACQPRSAPGSLTSRTSKRRPAPGSCNWWDIDGLDPAVMAGRRSSAPISYLPNPSPPPLTSYFLGADHL